MARMILISLAFIAARAFITGTQAFDLLTFSPLTLTLFKDAAHIWIGTVFGAWRVCLRYSFGWRYVEYRRWFWIMGGAECVCAAIDYVTK